MRTVLILALIFIVLPLLILAGASLALDPMLQSRVPARMSEALGVPVSLNDASASLGGALELEHLAIGNPEGYGDPQAIRVDRITAKAKPLSLLSDVVKIRTLTVERPLLSIEFKGLESNVKALIDNLPPRDEEKGKRFRIGRLTIEGATIRFTSDQIRGGTRTVSLPTIEMTNVGTAEDAQPMGGVAREVLQALLNEALKHAGDLPAGLVRSLGRAVEERAQDLLEGATERIEEVPGFLEDRLKREIEKRKAE